MGPGQDPFGHQDDVPHFDRAAHERAQRRSDVRREQRMANRLGVRLEPESSTTTSFFGIAASLAVILTAPFVISNLIHKRKNGQGPDKESKRSR